MFSLSNVVATATMYSHQPSKLYSQVHCVSVKLFDIKLNIDIVGFHIINYSLWDLNIESANLVPVETNLESTFSCSLQDLLSVGCG